MQKRVKDIRTTQEVCHSCRKVEIPERGFFASVFTNDQEHELYCHFCMKRVCSTECLIKEKFVIPRLFNVEYDLKHHSVCTKAGAFL